MLTWSGLRDGAAQGTLILILTWDLQTGGVVSTIARQGVDDQYKSRVTYSRDGRTIGVLHCNPTPIISIYDVVSGAHTHDVHHGAPEVHRQETDQPSYDIWTHEGSLRFVTADETTITIWEVGFTPGDTPAKVETLPTPKYFKGGAFIGSARFFPILRRLALIGFASARGLFVWDAQDSKPLLHITDVDFCEEMSFSSDGRFFACPTSKSEIYFWKESPAGYTLHGKLTPISEHSSPLLSPDGESIVVFGDSAVRLWRTKSFATTSSSPITRAPGHSKDFVLDFFPDSSLVVVARRGDEIMTVFDLKSGVSRLVINNSVGVYGLRVIGRTIIVMSDGKVFTWNLSGGDCDGMNADHSAQAVDFGLQEPGGVSAVSITPDFRHLAFIRQEDHYTTAGLVLSIRCLYVHNVSIGPRSTLDAVECTTLWFAPGGNDIWCAAKDEAQLVKITAHGLERTDDVRDVRDLPWGCPWKPSHGYQFTSDWWILSACGKRLFMLPPAWQSAAVHRMWSGQFLVLLHGWLPEPVILDLEP